MLERLARQSQRQATTDDVSDREHFNRVYNDESAWQGLSTANQSILPR